MTTILSECLLARYNYRILTWCSPYSQKNVQKCRCGAPGCRGVLGPRPKEREIRESKAELKKDAVQKKGKGALAGTKRKLGSVLDDSTSALNKKRKTLKGTSVKATISKAMTKAKSALHGKKLPVHVKKNVVVTKTNKTSKSTKTKTISKSKVTKVATAAKAAKASSKVKIQQVTKKHATKSAKSAKSATKETKPVSASERVRIRFKATARRSTSFKKGAQTLKAKSPGKKTPSKKTPIKSPGGSIKSKAAASKVGKK